LEKGSAAPVESEGFVGRTQVCNAALLGDVLLGRCDAFLADVHDMSGAEHQKTRRKWQRLPRNIEDNGP
jgi:hypothetical protein